MPAMTPQGKLSQSPALLPVVFDTATFARLEPSGALVQHKRTQSECVERAWLRGRGGLRT